MKSSRGSGGSGSGGDSCAVGTDLPPGAAHDSTDKGAVTLVLGDLAWVMRGAPGFLTVTARWWGEGGQTHTRRAWVRLDGECGAQLTFPVKCKPAGFARYCRDARAVVLEAGGGEKGMRLRIP